jgi:hypothetical protein
MNDIDQMTVHQMADAGICPKCRETGKTVYERYSFGVYAGIFCDECCNGYRDRCGMGGEQGDPRDLDEPLDEDW